jgi:hypothetical protein
MQREMLAAVVRGGRGNAAIDAGPWWPDDNSGQAVSNADHDDHPAARDTVINERRR